MTVTEEHYLVEDLFEDKGFEDAPLSDTESNFDEEGLISDDDDCTPVLPPAEQYCLKSISVSPALSTDPEERTDAVTNDISRRTTSTARNRSNGRSSSCGDFAIAREIYVKSGDFITDQKASKILKRGEESFSRGYGPFVPSHPRFERRHFEKENSWEPNIVVHSSLKLAEKTNPPTQLPNPSHVQLGAVTRTEGGNEKVTVFINLTNKQNNKTAVSHPPSTLPTTPQRYSSKPLSSTTTNDSPNIICDFTTGDIKTSTLKVMQPVSVVRRLVAQNIHETTVIFPERDSAREEYRAREDQSAGEVNSTLISVGEIQRILKSQPASSSPRTLMKVLEAYKRNRVKARRARGTLSSQRSTIPSPISSQAHEVGHARTVTNSADVWVIRVYLDTESTGTAMENTPCSRPCSASSLSAKAGVQCSSQRMIDVAKRSVLYIPQFEVAFGFVSIGDAAVSTVDVTNRTDRSLRLRAKLSHSGTPFALLDSQILVLDARQTTSLRIEFSPTQNARFCTSLLISVEGGGGPQMKYRMPVRGLGGAAVVTVKTRDDLRLSRKGTYILQSSYESTFSFGLTNSGNRTAFARIIVSYTGESNVAEHVPVDIRPASGVVIDRGESKQVSVRVRSPLYTHWRSSQNSIVSTASTARGASKLQVIVYWGEERTRQRLRCFEKISGNPHTREGLQFTDSFVGEVLAFRVPDDHPISKEDVRLFDQTLRTCIIYVCSPRIRPRPEPLRLRNHLGEVCSLRAPSVRKLPTNL